MKPVDLIIPVSLARPANLVWEACTEPERLMRWWGPKPAGTAGTVTLEEDQGTTRTLRHAGFPPGAEREMCEAGWNESFDNLAESLELNGLNRGISGLYR